MICVSIYEDRIRLDHTKYKNCWKFFQRIMRKINVACTFCIHQMVSQNMLRTWGVEQVVYFAKVKFFSIFLYPSQLMQHVLSWKTWPNWDIQFCIRRNDVINLRISHVCSIFKKSWYLATCCMIKWQIANSVLSFFCLLLTENL